MPPWAIEDAPADRVAHYLNVLGIEGEMAGWMDDLPRDEEFNMDDWGQ